MVQSLSLQDAPRMRRLKRDSRGVASTVATMLSLLVLLLFINLAIVDIVPRQENDAEFMTTQGAIGAFQTIHGLAQGPVIPSGSDLSSPGLTVAFPLGTHGVSPLEAPTTGTLTFNPGVGSAQIWFTFVPHFNRASVTHVDQDIVLAIDSSGSMTMNDPTNLRITGAQEYIGRLSCPDHVASVDFDTVAHVTRENIGGVPHHLTGVSNNCFPNFNGPKADLTTIDANGGTNIGEGLRVSVNELLGFGDAKRARVVILLTDGQNNFGWQDDLTRAQARRARDNGIIVYTIGLGAGADAALLTYVADTTGGTYYNAPTASSIRWIYLEISRHYTGAFVCGNLVSGDTGSGILSLELRNRQYPSQTLTYESGGIVRRQFDGARVLDGPGVGWTSTAPKGPQGALSLDLVALTGQEFRADGSETQLVSVRPIGRDLQELAITKVNLTTVSGLLTNENANLDYWQTQGAATAGAVANVKTPITAAKTSLSSAQTKVNNGNLTGAKFDVDSASSKLSAAITAAQQEADLGNMQKWLADQTSDDMLLYACYLTQWRNWYTGISIEVSSADAPAWEAWLNRTAMDSKMQYVISRPGNTAILTIRAVDKVQIERRILSVALAG